MRHDGLRRSSPPWPGAADMHFPLGDTFVERHKPFYIQQLRSSEYLATFTAQKYQGITAAGQIGCWFDWRIKNRSNFQEEIIYCIDTFLEASKCVMKVTWDTESGPANEKGEKKGQLCFEAIDPIYVIVPKGTQRLQDADRVVHVIPLSKEAYSRREHYDQKLLPSICGKEASESNIANYADDRYERAGITTGESDDEVIVWECYTRTMEGWEVETFSPLNPSQPVRPKYGLPYKHGQAPFVSFQYEIKDKGWYDNRGLVELSAPFETALCKHWNDQLDYMTIVNRPLFYSDNPIPNTANLRWQPGSILPFPVSSVQFQQPPISFDTQINFTRQTAEYRVGMPDYGIGQSQNPNEPRTAREISAIANVAGQNVDLRAFTFRLSLGQLFHQAYELQKQYGAEDDGLEFYHEGKIIKLPVEVLDNAFDIEPSGTADGSTKEQVLQKSIALHQMFKGDPHVNQGELTKSVLEAWGDGMVKKLYQDPNEKARTEYEDEASLIPALREGAPIQPRPEQDQNARIQSITDYIGAKVQSGQQSLPNEPQNLQMRINGHLAILSKKDPNAAKQWEMKLQQMNQALAPEEAQAA